MRGTRNRSGAAAAATIGLWLAMGMAEAASPTNKIVDQAFDIDPGAAVSVSTANGAIELVGTDAKQASLVILSSNTKLDDRYTLTIDAKPDRLNVVLKAKNGSGWMSWFNSSNLRFELRVPRRSDVVLSTAGGPLTVREIEGKVSLDTSGGPIDVSAVTGDVSADTSGGPITISDVRGNIVADTSGGPIQIDEAHGSVQADTSGGPIDVRFAKGNDKGGSLSTSGGSITVAVDPSVRLDISGSTSGGRVTCDLPLTVKRQSKQDIEGTLNGGGAKLVAETSGGSVSLRAR